MATEDLEIVLVVSLADMDLKNMLAAVKDTGAENSHE